MGGQTERGHNNILFAFLKKRGDKNLRFSMSDFLI